MSKLVKSCVIVTGLVTCLTGCGSDAAPSHAAGGNSSSGSGSSAGEKTAAGDAGDSPVAGGAGRAAGGAAGNGGVLGGSGGEATGMGGAGGEADQGPAGQAFVPDVPWQYVGKGPSAGLEVVASTLVNTEVSVEWLVAVKNTGPDPICLVSVPTEFQ